MSLTVSTDVPTKYPVALGGRGFMLDLGPDSYHLGADAFGHETVPVIRAQQDSGNEPGGQTLDPQGLWRRNQDDWSHGAGQSHYDRSTSDRAQFRSSLGVDVWTPHQISLLNAVARKLTSANTNLFLVAAGARLYVTDGTGIRYTADVTTWTACTGTSATAATGIASDGFNVYSTHAADGIYSSNTGTGAFASFNTRVANGICAYVKGRLLISNDNVLVNITGASAETIILTHPNTAFRWVGAAEGPGFIYTAGFSGDKSLIYKTTIKADGTALDFCTVAGELPDGEIVRSIQGYLGMLLVGTDKGVRVLQLDSSGNVAGSSRVIPATSAVSCFEPQDRFVWYGLTNYDGTHTGLGRLDLMTFTFPLTPAYATDLMALNVQGAVQSVVTFGAKRVFTISGSGVYQESTNKEPVGTLDGGLMSYGIVNKKRAVLADMRNLVVAHEQVDLWLSTDGGSFVYLGKDGTSSTSNRTSADGTTGAAPPDIPPFSTTGGSGDTFELRPILYRHSVDTTLGPTVTRTTMMINPIVDSGEFITFPIIIGPVYNTGFNEEPRDAASDKAFLRALRADRSVVACQEGTDTVSVTVEDYTFKGYKMIEIDGAQFYIGTWVVKLKTIPEGI